MASLTTQWAVVQYTDRHTGKPAEGAYYIATPDGGRWIVDDHELAEKVVHVLNNHEGAVKENERLRKALREHGAHFHPPGGWRPTMPEADAECAVCAALAVEVGP